MKFITPSEAVVLPSIKPSNIEFASVCFVVRIRALVRTLNLYPFDAIYISINQTASSVLCKNGHILIYGRTIGAGDSMARERKKKTGKEQVDESYQPGNIGSMAGTLPSVKGKKTSGSESR